jgi:hypothetical protein
LPSSAGLRPRQRPKPDVLKKLAHIEMSPLVLVYHEEPIQKVERHVELAESLPFMQKNGWVPNQVLQEGEDAFWKAARIVSSRNGLRISTPFTIRPFSRFSVQSTRQPDCAAACTIIASIKIRRALLESALAAMCPASLAQTLKEVEEVSSLLRGTIPTFECPGHTTDPSRRRIHSHRAIECLSPAEESKKLTRMFGSTNSPCIPAFVELIAWDRANAFCRASRYGVRVSRRSGEA